MLAIIQPLEDDGTLVKRDRALIESEISNFTVIEHDRVIFGCAALYPFPDDGMAEMACLAVNPRRRAWATASACCSASSSARGPGHHEVLRADHAHGALVPQARVSPGLVEDLPRERKNLYNWQRKSQVLIKTL